MKIPRWLRLPPTRAEQYLESIRATVERSDLIIRRMYLTVHRMREIMAADREMLASLAADVSALATPVQELLDNYAAANARIAELEGQAAADEVADLEAIRPVRDAFDAVAAKFRAEPDVPDVEPLPGDEQSENLPADEDGDESDDEGARA